jgi:hypothetical protein
MPTAEIEPTIPASERPHTDALDRTATGIDIESVRSVVNTKVHSIYFVPWTVHSLIMRKITNKMH